MTLLPRRIELISFYRVPDFVLLRFFQTLLARLAAILSGI